MGAHWAHWDTIEGLRDETAAESVKLVFQLRDSAELTDDSIYFHSPIEHIDSAEVVHILLQVLHIVTYCFCGKATSLSASICGGGDVDVAYVNTGSNSESKSTSLSSPCTGW